MDTREKLFIDPDVNVQTDSDHFQEFANLSKEILRTRWSSERGRRILSTWKASGFQRQALDELVGKFYDHTDLRGIPLSGEVLEKVALNEIDFYGANLEGTSFIQADLSGSYLSEANIKGARFDWSNMKRVYLDGVEYDNETSFVGVDLSAVNFNLAALLHDLALTQQRIAHLQQRHPTFAAFLRITSNFGLSLKRYFAWVGAIIVLFGLIYGLAPNLISSSGLWQGLYFSVVTFTTLGYGDVYPVSTLGQIVTILEVALGYVMGGLLIAILARRMIGS